MEMLLLYPALVAPITLAPTVSTPSGSLRWLTQSDPLISRILLPEAREGSLDDLAVAAAGMGIWRRALAAGRAPDFGGLDDASMAWPSQPLRSALEMTMTSIDLPRVTARHPSLIPAALMALLAASVRFGRSRDDMDAASADDGSASGVGGDASRDEALNELARQAAEALAAEWSAPLQGVRAVESLGGRGGGDAGAMTAEDGRGFSPHDGLWKHVGWDVMESVQRKLRDLDELTALIGSLGSR